MFTAVGFADCGVTGFRGRSCLCEKTFQTGGLGHCGDGGSGYQSGGWWKGPHLELNTPTKCQVLYSQSTHCQTLDRLKVFNSHLFKKNTFRVKTRVSQAVLKNLKKKKLGLQRMMLTAGEEATPPKIAPGSP